MKKLILILCLLISTPAFAGTYALINASDVVVGFISYDGVSPYTPPTGYQIVRADNVTPPPSVGYTYADGVFTNPNAGE